MTGIMAAITRVFSSLFGTKKRTAGTGAGVAGLALTIGFVGGWEGVKYEAYYDVVGVPTICQGLTHGVKMGDRATPEECDARFAAELQTFEKGVSACVKDWEKLPTKTKVSLVSWAYNIGVHGACSSTAVKRFNAGDYRAGCEAMTWWNKGTINGEKVRLKGLVNRRKAEHALCTEDL